MAATKGSKKALSAAIAKAVAPAAPTIFDGAEDTPFSKAIASGETLVSSDLLASELSPAQVEGIERFAVLCMEHDTARAHFTELCDVIVKDVGQMPWEVWKKVIGAIRADIGQYPAECYRGSYKRLFGALPNAGKGSGNGGKGMGGKRFASGLETRVAEVIDFITKNSNLPAVKADVTAAMLKVTAEAAANLLKAAALMKRQVNE